MIDIYILNHHFSEPVLLLYKGRILNHYCLHLLSSNPCLSLSSTVSARHLCHRQRLQVPWRSSAGTHSTGTDLHSQRGKTKDLRESSVGNGRPKQGLLNGSWFSNVFFFLMVNCG